MTDDSRTVADTEPPETPTGDNLPATIDRHHQLTIHDTSPTPLKDRLQQLWDGYHRHVKNLGVPTDASYWTSPDAG
jgi:hypothetical protein